MNKLLTLAIGTSILLSASCKKTTPITAESVTCMATLHGYFLSSSSPRDTGVCIFGTIDDSSAVLSSLGTFSSSPYSNQAAYNTADNCYYAFKITTGSAISSGPLYKMSATGAVKALTCPVTSDFSSLTYNAVTGSLYAVAGGHLVQLTITDSTFAYTNVATPVHAFPFNYKTAYVPLTVDNTTGDMYYITGDTTHSFVEKYHPGTAPVVIAPVTGGWTIMGLQFNKNDNRLYAARENYPDGLNCSFIRIDPASGSVSVLAALKDIVNPDAYATALDQCSNRYIYSKGNLLVQLNMTGTVVQRNVLTNFYQGLTAN